MNIHTPYPEIDHGFDGLVQILLSTVLQEELAIVTYFSQNKAVQTSHNFSILKDTPQAVYLKRVIWVITIGTFERKPKFGILYGINTYTYIFRNQDLRSESVSP